MQLLKSSEGQLLSFMDESEFYALVQIGASLN